MRIVLSTSLCTLLLSLSLALSEGSLLRRNGNLFRASVCVSYSTFGKIEMVEAYECGAARSVPIRGY